MWNFVFIKKDNNIRLSIINYILEDKEMKYQDIVKEIILILSAQSKSMNFVNILMEIPATKVISYRGYGKREPLIQKKKKKPRYGRNMILLI